MFSQKPLLWWTQPLAFSRPLRTLGVFVCSGIFHGILEWGGLRESSAIEVLYFYTACGAVCILEDGFTKVTGRKVGGMWGRVWFWTVRLVVGWRWTWYMWTHGWAAHQNTYTLGHPGSTILDWVLYWTGIRDAWSAKT